VERTVVISKEDYVHLLGGHVSRNMITCREEHGYLSRGPWVSVKKTMGIYLSRIHQLSTKRIMIMGEIAMVICQTDHGVGGIRRS